MIENIFTIILINCISKARVSDFDLSTLNISHLEITSMFLILFFKIKELLLIIVTQNLRHSIYGTMLHSYIDYCKILTDIN